MKNEQYSYRISRTLVCSIDWWIAFVAMQELRGNIYLLALDSIYFCTRPYFLASYNPVSTFSNSF